MLEKEDELLFEEARDLIFQRLVPLKDNVSLLVIGHLFVEHWLDWLIQASIPSPEKLLDSGRLTFAQKLAVVESLGLVREKVAEAIRILNNIRNRVTHRLEFDVDPKDLQLLAKFTSPINSEQ